jgi:hypothetical protein
MGFFKEWIKNFVMIVIMFVLITLGDIVLVEIGVKWGSVIEDTLRTGGLLILGSLIVTGIAWRIK